MSRDGAVVIDKVEIDCDREQDVDRLDVLEAADTHALVASLAVREDEVQQRSVGVPAGLECIANEDRMTAIRTSSTVDKDIVGLTIRNAPLFEDFEIFW